MRPGRRYPGRVAVAALAVGWLAFAGPSGAADDGRAPVVPPQRNLILVYYANETSRQAAESENYTGLLSILRSSPSLLAGRIADSIVEDATEFPAAVRSDIGALTAAARRWRFDLAIFTNDLALAGTFIFQRHAGGGKGETRRLPVLPTAASPILATSPLARADYLRAALFEIGGLYPPGTVDVILAVNTHGGGDLALTPRVFADVAQASAADLRAAVDGAPASGAAPRWVTIRGTPKAEFWPILAEASMRYGIRFPLVFREACASGVASWAEHAAIPDSVDLVAHTGTANLLYRDVDYAEIFATAPPDRPLSEFLALELRRRQIQVDTRSALWRGLLVDTAARHYPVFFAPLAIWLLWFGLTALRNRRHR